MCLAISTNSNFNLQVLGWLCVEGSNPSIPIKDTNSDYKTNSSGGYDDVYVSWNKGSYSKIEEIITDNAKYKILPCMILKAVTAILLGKTVNLNSKYRLGIKVTY